MKSRRRSCRSLFTIAALTVFALIALPSAPALATCDPLDPAVCMQPFPNDFFTVADNSTDTGKRVNFQLTDMPRNRANKPIDTLGYNHNDGFSPGAKIVTKVPGLDNIQAFHRTRAVPITDMARYTERNAPVVLINADTHQRHPIWTEMDANPANPDDVNLIIRPAVNLDEGGHYIVALRFLKTASGRTIRAGMGFRTYRDKLPSSDPTVTQARRDHFEDIFHTLRQAGMRRKDLFLAWDFTVASQRNLSERMLSIRDDAFSNATDGLHDPDLSDLTLQGSAPSFVVTASCTDSGCSGTPTPQIGCSDVSGNTRIARCIEGRFTVPCYLDAPGCPPGAQFAYAPGSDVPVRIPGNTFAANFICQVPRTALPTGGGVVPARPSLYGHGLLGEASEVTAGNVEAMSYEHNFTFCATDWIGMSITDAPNVLSLLQDLSGFPSLTDRAQQGFLDFMYLGRLMLHPNGFASDPAFQQSGQYVIDPARLFYDGNSQGGIMGGGLTAVEPDLNRSVLGVPGMNYSILLRRSVDFDQYAEGSFEGSPDTDAGLYDNYPNELERPLILSLIQMLWDRGEADGYAHHMTSDPYPNTPAHRVLLHMAFGDHQVANVAAEVEARTIGAYVHQPALDPGRSADVHPYWGIPAIPSYPFNGSALVVWDSGRGQVGTPPTTNTPPRPELGYGNDPHSHPRSTVAARTQKSNFLQIGGQVVDVCNGLPCHSDAFNPGPPFFNGP